MTLRSAGPFKNYIKEALGSSLQQTVRISAAVPAASPRHDDLMAKVGVNRCGVSGAWSPGLLLTPARWILLTLTTPSLTSTTRSTSSRVIPPTANFKAHSGPRTANLSSMKSSFLSCRSEILPTSNGVMLVLSTLWSPLGSSPHGRLGLA